MDSTGHRRYLSAFAAAILLVISTTEVYANPVDLSDSPLYVLQGVDPNIILTLDDSGSMYWSFMPDGIFGQFATDRAKSHVFNKMYYNPAVRYDPPVDEDGNSIGDASFTAAWLDGYHKAATCTSDLSANFLPTWYYGNNCDGVSAFLEYSSGPEPAYYYVFDSGNAGCSGSINDDDCYDKVVVSATSGPGGTDETVNFANWFSYYRKRLYVMKAAASRSFANLSDDFRLARQRINDTSATALSQMAKFSGSVRTGFYNWLFDVGAMGGTPLRAAAARAGDYLSEAPPDEGSFLSPYADDPEEWVSGDNPERSCRQNFQVMMTDGYWNSTAGVAGNVDGNAQTIPPNDLGITAYSPRPPYADENVAFLADNGFAYWYRDLRDDLDNNVPASITDLSTDIDGDGVVDNDDIFWNPANDPAEWQHMVTYTIGLGVDGDLSYPGDYAGLLSGSQAWGSDEIDDLWHTAINSRGKYFAADDAASLINSFSDVIRNIIDRTGSSAPVALNTGTITSETMLYQARFDTAGWGGHLIASKISDGSNCGTVPIGTICSPSWDAACRLDGGFCNANGMTYVAQDPNARSIITTHSDSGGGVKFRWADLSSSQQGLLRDPDGALGPLPEESDSYGQDRLDFIRGDDADEAANGGAFRNRVSKLGDIIYSNPTYVGEPARYYSDPTVVTEFGSYFEWATALSDREPMVYVGSNDGMLHAFRASDGVESLAFIPNEVFSNLWRLSRPDYSHSNYVDGPIAEGDVYYGDDWHTVLVGGLGLGGQGYYALDVTDPSSFGEGAAANLVRWEFTDADDADMGDSYGKPSIVRLHNGAWGAVFGNGFNSTEGSDGNIGTSGNAVVFIVDIATGNVIKKLDTGVGKDSDPTGQSRPNGIAGIRPVDLDGDFVTDRLYAGDLFGNIWVWDLSNSNTAQWKLAYGTSTPLFTAINDSGESQPITTAPQVDIHPTGVGVMVYFGTGKYLGTGDLVDTSVQSFYGIWDGITINNDNPKIGASRSSLQEQEVISVNLTQFGGYDARVVSNNPIRWDDYNSPTDTDEVLGWYMDLPESGERVHQTPVVRNGRVIFVTVTPSSNPCESGGTSWLMEIDARNGGRLATTPFDYDSDGIFTLGDLVQPNIDMNGDGVIDDADKTPGGGIRVDDSGIYTSPAVVMHPDNRTEGKTMSTSKGSVKSVTEDSGLNWVRSWSELR